MEGAATIPDEVWVIGRVRDPATYHTPITTPEGLGLAPLTVLDADEERALPVFTTRQKAERGLLYLTSEEERSVGPLATALIDLDDLLKAFRVTPEGAPKVDYIGLNMGEGGVYPLLRP
jgi:hypothetical protein